MELLQEGLIELLKLSRGVVPAVGLAAALVGVALLFRGAGLVRGFLGLAGGLILTPVLAARFPLGLSAESATAVGALAGFVLGGFLPFFARALAGGALVSLFLPELSDLTGGTLAGEVLALTLGAALGVNLAAWVESGIASSLGLLALSFGGEVLLPELHPLSSLFSLFLGILPPGPGLSPPRLVVLLLIGLFVLAVRRQGRWATQQGA